MLLWATIQSKGEHSNFTTNNITQERTSPIKSIRTLVQISMVKMSKDILLKFFALSFIEKNIDVQKYSPIKIKTSPLQPFDILTIVKYEISHKSLPWTCFPALLANGHQLFFN